VVTFWPNKLPIHWSCVTATKSLNNYRTYNTTNHSRFVDAQWKVLSIQHLLPSIIVFIMISTYWMSFWLIETWPCGKTEHSNILALFVLTQQNFMYLTKSFIAPAIHLFINRYPQTTVLYSAITYL
jgi:hypothetical protein